LIHTTQINGGFYSAPGIELAVMNSVRVLESSRSPLEALL
jgi:capsular polysaccharide export protein